ncbi:hypothetical protein O6H91_21G028000 [Diphasiastrum complanatum]|uniref:Uncharacterized protein n=1 Tax=Diphasiastrum complanatum TaxID=34168 RepID=A0ACC2AJ99_DIPCM|nr:hypothetical protein O6H91_21G028000 [Diphasiastrum complanatum]
MCKGAMSCEDKLGICRAPSSKPPFTLSEIRRAVPGHCFNRSLVKSGAYLAGDLLTISLLFYATRYFDHAGFFEWPLWMVYWVIQGCVATGVWVIAHECGHHAFSNYAWVDDLVGFVFHSLLLVPYFSWKFSHKRHHGNNGNIERDEVFVPKVKEDISWFTTLLQHPTGRIVQAVMMLLLGWPLYLTLNVSGRKYERFACHFDPNGPIFKNQERLQVLVSDLGLLGVCYCLWQLSCAYGYVWLFMVYGVPLLIVNAWLVLITFLQHTHPSLPHYNDSQWEWLKGELVTIDRDYGILNHIFHHITDTHVAHHLFTTMPHYHAEEATKAIIPVLGKYYQYDKTPIHFALYRELKECVFVEPDSPDENGVLWFNSKFS